MGKKKKPQAETPQATPTSEWTTKRNAKDTVFRDLFSRPEYTLELYNSIHPEDTDVSLSDISNVTIENVITDQEYNDLGMTVREKRILLVEAQSTWTYNVVPRTLLYLAHELNDYLEETKQDRYGKKKVNIPIPELYVIYTGDRGNKQEWMSLADEFFGGERTFIDMKVKVLFGEPGSKDIISQYVEFTKVFNAQVKKYGRDKKAAMETIRICQDQDVLREYLTERRKEVVDIMMALFDEQKVQEQFGNGRYREGAENRAVEMAKKMIQKGKLTLEEIAEYSGLSLTKVQELAQTATA